MPQSLSRSLQHLIFSTKNRDPALTEPTRSRLHEYFAGILREIECPPIQIGGVADHVHLLFGLSRTMSIAEVVEKIKTSSSKWLKLQGAEFNGFHWQNGYAIFSVSESQIDVVEQYILRQEDHHRTMTFQEEYRRFLVKHRVSFDERYVWD